MPKTPPLPTGSVSGLQYRYLASRCMPRSRCPAARMSDAPEGPSVWMIASLRTLAGAEVEIFGRRLVRAIGPRKSRVVTHDGQRLIGELRTVRRTVDASTVGGGSASWRNKRKCAPMQRTAGAYPSRHCSTHFDEAGHAAVRSADVSQHADRRAHRVKPQSETSPEDAVYTPA